MNTIRAIYFDAVGTLIHPEPAVGVVYAEAGRRFGSRYTSEIIAQRFGEAFQAQEALDRANGWITSEQRERRRWRDIVGTVLDNAADPASCFDFLYSHFARPESWRCEPGADVLFKELAGRDYILGLASNLDERLYALVHGLAPLQLLSKNIVVSCAVGFRKPAREFFQAMCRQTGLLPAKILHVGDDPGNDYAGAEAAGMRALLFDPRGKYENLSAMRIRTLGEVCTSL